MSRQVASGRTAAVNRVAVQDIRSSLKFSGATKVVATALTGLSAGFTYCGVVKFGLTMGKTVALFGNSTGAGDSAGITLNSGYLRGSYNNGSDVGAKSLPESMLAPNRFYKIVYTFDGANGALYLDAISSATGTFGASLATNANLSIGARTDGLLGFLGVMSAALIYKRVLTQAEILNFQRGYLPDNPAVRYEFQEGAGDTAYDTSGNGNNGTITNGTFTSDTPSKKRGVVGGNLVYNGDFEYAPPFTAATNVANRFVDGTAAGSTTNALFGWATNYFAGSGEVAISTVSPISGLGSLRISTKAINSQIYATTASFNNVSGSKTYRANENTSYTLNYKLATSVISGAANTGAGIEIRFFDGSGSTISTVATTSLTTTAPTTVYSKVFTTPTNTRYIAIQPRITGNDGTGTLIMDAWFDDIDLRPTTPVIRGVVS